MIYILIYLGIGFITSVSFALYCEPGYDRNNYLYEGTSITILFLWPVAAIMFLISYTTFFIMKLFSLIRGWNEI